MLGPVGWGWRVALELNEKGLIFYFLILSPLQVGQRGDCRTAAVDTGWRDPVLGHGQLD